MVSRMSSTAWLTFSAPNSSPSTRQRLCLYSANWAARVSPAGVSRNHITRLSFSSRVRSTSPLAINRLVRLVTGARCDAHHVSNLGRCRRAMCLQVLQQKGLRNGQIGIGHVLDKTDEFNCQLGQQIGYFCRQFIQCWFHRMITDATIAQFIFMVKIYNVRKGRADVSPTRTHGQCYDQRLPIGPI